MDSGLIDQAHSEPLSRVLPKALSVARRMGDEELADWVRLELSGYFADNPAMNDDTIVPPYRSVPGHHFDRGRRLIDIRDPELGFLNTDRLRFGVAQLEELAKKGETICVGQSAGMEIIRRELGADAYSFCFEPTSVTGVLEAIRAHLVDRLEDHCRPVRSRGMTGDPVGQTTHRGRMRKLVSWVFDSAERVAILVVAGLIVAYLTFVFEW